MLKNPYYQYGKMNTVVPARINFGEYLLEKMWRVRHKDAFINGETNESVSYGKLCQEGMNFAVSLTLLGVRKGDTIAICTENRPEFWSVLLGTICTGSAFTPMNPGYTDGELKHAIKISKPKFIVVSETSYKQHEKFFTTTFSGKVILLGDERRNNVISFNDIAVSNNGSGNVIVNNRLSKNVTYEEFEVANVKGQIDTLFILYSSGTTGLSKGVLLTHLNLLAQCVPSNDEIDENMGLNITPWFHSLGLVGLLSNIIRGKTYVYLPKFDVHLYLKTIEKYKMIAMTVVPPVLVAISKVAGDYDLSSVLLIFSGAAPLHKETADLVKSKFPNVLGIFQGYGMTEATMALTIAVTDDGEFVLKPGSVGKPVGGTIIKVVDIESRKLLGPNQTGEICAKGIMMMKGYVGRDKREDFDEEGFFKTGDVGYYDEDGCFFIVDRMKELIKYKGFQVAPAEIEALLLQHEAIRDVGVVGIPHRSAGEVPLAFVVLQPGMNITEKEVKQFVADKLSSPKHLRGGVRFIQAIPKNPSGKILRKTLRQMAKSEKSKL